jgi:hypothetical protein
MERSALHRKLKSLGVQYGDKISAVSEVSQESKKNPEKAAGQGR